jgi:hypothetical protein
LGCWCDLVRAYLPQKAFRVRDHKRSFAVNCKSRIGTPTPWNRQQTEITCQHSSKKRPQQTSLYFWCSKCALRQKRNSEFFRGAQVLGGSVRYNRSDQPSPRFLITGRTAFRENCWLYYWVKNRGGIRLYCLLSGALGWGYV